MIPESSGNSNTAWNKMHAKTKTLYPLSSLLKQSQHSTATCRLATFIVLVKLLKIHSLMSFTESLLRRAMSLRMITMFALVIYINLPVFGTIVVFSHDCFFKGSLIR